MIAKRLAAILLGLSVVLIAGPALAQSDPENGAEPKASLMDRLDNFGKKVFNGILPPSKSKPKTKSKPGSDTGRQSSMYENSDSDNSARAGSVLANGARRPSADSRGAPDDIAPRNDAPPRDELQVMTAPVRQDPFAAPSGARASDDQSSPSSDPVKPSGHALHERMAAFRQSAFDADPAKQSRPQADARTNQSPIAEPKEMGLAGGDVAGVVARRSSPDPHIGDPATGAPALGPAGIAAGTPGRVDETPPATQNADAVKPLARDGVLIKRNSPVLSVTTVGPRTITVGRESTYEVSITNSGDVSAEGVIVFVSLPAWAEVAGAGASAGTAEMAGAGEPAGTIQWKIGFLNGRGRERLSLKITPRQNRSFDLGVHFAYKPSTSQASIEVQEPKLLLQLEGPREVLYGKKQLYHLKLANTGNGSAENVVLTLMPIGTGANVPASHRAGLLTAGQEKVLDVELTARQNGNLTIQVDARADGGAHAELSEKVMVRRAGLTVALDGPKGQFVGAAAGYTVTIRNPGNAPAHGVNLSLTLPAGARYVSGVEGARQQAAGGRVDWTIESLGPGVEQSFTLKCAMGLAGEGQFRLDATAGDDLSASTEMQVRIQSVANLTMDVKDPAGPVPVGEEATYEIHVRNRGTREAQGVEIFGYFSRGVEPTAADGAANRLGPGQVIFQPIPSLAPGAEVVLKVRAKAEVAGNHVFRAEAHCKPLGARLVREATNLYYGDMPAAQEASRGSSAPLRPQAK